MSAYALPGSLFPPLGGSSSEKNACSSNKPLQHYKKKGRIGHFSLNDVLSSVTFEKNMEQEQPQETKSTNEEVGIAVKQAKLDPVRLVQAVTKEPTRRQTCSNASHEDAIQFELSIAFNGRTYSATRTLPRLVELRNDLIRELNSRRKSLQNRRMRWNGKNLDGDDDTVATVDDCDDEDVQIPEIPECNTESVAVNGGGVAGRGFAMLQALLGPYCPAIERWLKTVTDLVPPTSSPSLSNFLWEPVSADIGTKCGMRASSSLECIAEDSDSEEECDEEE